MATDRDRLALVVLFHLVLVLVSHYLAWLLLFDGNVPEEEWGLFLQTVPWLVLIRGTMFIPFRVYMGLWRYAGIWDLCHIIGGILSSALVFYLVVEWGLGIVGYPRSVYFIDYFVLVSMMWGARVGQQVFQEFGREKGKKRVLIFGAGNAGEMIVRAMRNNELYDYEPVGFIDDDPKKLGLLIHGVKVLGSRPDLAKIFRLQRPEEVLVAIPSAKPSELRSLVKSLEQFRVPIKTLPNLRDILNGKVSIGSIQPLSLEHLLPRAPVDLNLGPVQSFIRGKRILVTGGGGSIGSELCRQIATFGPSDLVLFERYENALYEVTHHITNGGGLTRAHFCLGDITDVDRLNSVMSEY